MSETLNKLDQTLGDLIDKASQTGPKVIDWLYVEVPDLVNQILLWNGILSGLHFLLGFLLVFIMPIVWWKCFAKTYIFGEKQPDSDDSVWVPIVLGSGIFFVATQLPGWNLIDFDWLKILVAPKVYMIEYIGNLTK